MSGVIRKDICRKCKRRRANSDLLDGDLCRSCHASSTEHRHLAGEHRQTDCVAFLKGRVSELEAELRSVKDEPLLQPVARRSRPVSLSSGSGSSLSPSSIPELLPLSSALAAPAIKPTDIIIQPADLEALAERLTISTHGEAFPYGPVSNPLLVADSPPSSPSIKPSLPPVSFLPLGTTPALIDHLLTLYFRWHHPVFIFFSKPLFLAHLATGGKYCTPLLLNAVLAYACSISDEVQIRSNPADPSTAGDAFMAMCRSIMDGELHSSPSVTTVSALNLMAKREAAFGRANLGWLYSGIAFRIAIGLGLHLDPSPLVTDGLMSEEDARVRKAVFWGCYANDKAWSAYLGRPNSIRPEIVTTPRMTDDAAGESTTAVHSSSPEYLNYPGLLHSNTLFYCFVDIWDYANDMLTSLYSNSTNPLAREAAQPALRLAEQVKDWRAALPACAQLGPSFSGPIVTLLHMLSENVILLAFRPLVDVRNLEPTPRSRCLAAAKKICGLLEQYRTSFGLRIISLNFIYVVSTAATVLIYERSRGPTQELYELLNLCMSSLDEIAKNGWKSSAHAARGLRKLEQQSAGRLHVRRSSSSYSQSQADAMRPTQQQPAFPFRTHQPMAQQMDMNFGYSEQPFDNSMHSFNQYHFGQQIQQPWIVGDDPYLANFANPVLF